MNAQIMIDQYISYWKDKWNNQNGIVIYYLTVTKDKERTFFCKNGALFNYCARHNMYGLIVLHQPTSFNCWEDKWKRISRKPLIVFLQKFTTWSQDVFSTVN